jgi:hypothetical protein
LASVWFAGLSAGGSFAHCVSAALRSSGQFGA